MPHIRAHHMLTRSHGRVNKITPGTSTVATFKTTTGNFARISDCLKHTVE